MNRSSGKPPRPARRQPRRVFTTPQTLPFTAKDRRLLGTGISVILLGYIALSLPPVNGFLSLTFAPLLLLTGYCVVIPLALLGRPGKGL